MRFGTRRQISQESHWTHWSDVSGARSARRASEYVDGAMTDDARAVFPPYERLAARRETEKKRGGGPARRVPSPIDGWIGVRPPPDDDATRRSGVRATCGRRVRRRGDTRRGADLSVDRWREARFLFWAPSALFR
jgi:hypothetical protein